MAFWDLPLPLFQMKQKLPILNVALMLTVLFAILFQSLHSYEHLVEHHPKSEIDHRAENSEKGFHQNTHDHEKCFACEFVFSSFVGASFTTYSFDLAFEAVCYNFSYNETPSFFSGSLLSLRGPPAIC